jgi:hypothetical protein
MKLLLSAVIVCGLCSAAAVAQTPAPPPSGATERPEQQITLVGCVQREADYRKAQDKDRGGVAGTGVGGGDEFVLTNASMATQGLSPSAPAADTEYELTGANEEQVKEFVGKRVEIVGTLKPAAMTGAGRPTGGATAGTPPSGIDLTSKDLKLRELEVASVKAMTGTCPAM